MYIYKVSVQLSYQHQPQGKLCPYKRFPTHRYAHMQRVCGFNYKLLLETIKLSGASEKCILYPLWSIIHPIIYVGQAIQTCNLWPLMLYCKRGGSDELAKITTSCLQKIFGVL